MSTKKKKLLVIGECMMELQGNVTSNKFSAGFAGDTFNMAVYAKRWCPESIDVSYMTAIGTDIISEEMLAYFNKEALDCSLVFKSDSAIPGVYLINVDNEGERTFIYWRENSAAREMPALLRGLDNVDALAGFDALFFSGISLAILSDMDKVYLLSVIADLKDSGTTVIFDPNYRPLLWPSLTAAQQWVRKAYALADIALPGLDDEQALFNHANHLCVYTSLSRLKIAEMVIKSGCDGVYLYDQCKAEHVPFIAAEKQLDATAAGDSFAGTYVAARLLGLDKKRAAEMASAISREVVQHKGAVLSHEVYQQARKSAVQ